MKGFYLNISRIILIITFYLLFISLGTFKIEECSLLFGEFKLCNYVPCCHGHVCLHNSLTSIDVTGGVSAAKSAFPRKTFLKLILNVYFVWMQFCKLNRNRNKHSLPFVECLGEEGVMQAIISRCWFTLFFKGI